MAMTEISVFELGSTSWVKLLLADADVPSPFGRQVLLVAV